MVLAQADVVAWVPLGAALTHDDVAGAHGLAAELLHAKALALTVAAVAGRAACFFMCHVELLLRSFLGRGLSRCSIFCRPGFSLGLRRSGLFGRLFSTGGLLVCGCRIFRRCADHFIRLMLSSGRVGRLISARGSGLVHAALGHLALRGGSGSSFGLRGRLFFGLVIAGR